MIILRKPAFSKVSHGIPWNTHSTLSESCGTLPREPKGWWNASRAWLHDVFVAVVNDCQKDYITSVILHRLKSWSSPMVDNHKALPKQEWFLAVWTNNRHMMVHLLLWFLVHVSCQNLIQQTDGYWENNTKGGCNCYIWLSMRGSHVDKHWYLPINGQCSIPLSLPNHQTERRLSAWDRASDAGPWCSCRIAVPKSEKQSEQLKRVLVMRKRSDYDEEEEQESRWCLWWE